MEETLKGTVIARGLLLRKALQCGRPAGGGDSGAVVQALEQRGHRHQFEAEGVVRLNAVRGPPKERSPFPAVGAWEKGPGGAAAHRSSWNASATLNIPAGWSSGRVRLGPHRTDERVGPHRSGGAAASSAVTTGTASECNRSRLLRRGAGAFRRWPMDGPLVWPLFVAHEEQMGCGLVVVRGLFPMGSVLIIAMFKEKSVFEKRVQGTDVG